MAYPFAAAEVLTAANLNAMIGAPPQNAQTGTTYSLALSDAGKTVTLSNASPVTVTVPAQATVTWIADTQIDLLNLGAGLVTISPAAGVTINGTPLTLETSKGGTLIRTASNTWTFVPTGGAGGKILQVVRATDTTERTTTSITYVDVTGMTVTITPTKNTSYLFIIATFLGGNNAGLQGLRLTTSGGTALSGAEDFTNGANLNPSNFRNPVVLWGYIAPATSSPVTYKLQQKLVSGTGTLAVVQNQLSTGQMYAIEVAA